MRYYILILTLFISQVLYSDPKQLDHVQVELISNYESITPETKEIFVGVRFKMEKGWHIYYKYPGIAGLPPQATWDFANQFDFSGKANTFIWPTPKSFTAAGIKSYGYEDEAILSVPLKLIEKVQSGDSLKIQAKLRWLLCKDICIPQNTDLTLTIKVDTQAQKSKWADYYANDFQKNRAQTTPNDNLKGGIFQNKLYIELDQDTNKAELIPSIKNFINETADQKIKKSKDNIKYLEVPLSKKFANQINTGLLIYTNQKGEKQALEIRSKKIPDIQIAFQKEKVKENEKQDGAGGFAFILLSALIGGLILNVMPCVFPVLSLKIFSFIEQSGEDKAKIRLHGIVFTLGVLISFWVLVTVMLLFRSAGENIGWGFQLQEPGFVIGLTIFFFIFALNLFGVFEIGTSMTRLGGLGSQSTGLASSFVTGVLATLAATPCSAPFLATALGATLTLPSLEVFIVFTVIALGMALPYLILSFFPALLKFLPRPGAWMEAFKIFMGFLLIATVAWLIKVYGKLTDLDDLFIFLIALVTIAIAFWILGRWSIPGKSSKAQWLGRAFFLLFLFISGYLFTLEKSQAWEAFSPAKVTKYQEQGYPVFIDFTAEWCVTCQSNKLTVLKTDEIKKEFEKYNVKTLVADWTKKDDTITEELAQYDRNAVPFYLLYTGKKGEKPFILPELLTKGIVKDYLKKLPKK